MSDNNSGSWDIPTYTAPTPSSFSNPYGTSQFKDNTYSTNLSSGTQDYYNQLDAMRKSIYSGLGYTSQAREASLNQWQDTFTKEALRTSQPQLEQSLFARGLGGSKYYSDSLTDLLSKVNTQGVLNREQLSTNDQNMQLQYLNSINPEIQNILSQVNGLNTNTANQGNIQNQQAWNQYSSMLPYTATYNSNSNDLSSITSLLGSLSSLLGGSSGGNFANISGMGQVPVAPQNYYLSNAARLS